MIGDRAFKTKSAEPAIGEVEIRFLAQPALGANAEKAADPQHPQHQFRIEAGRPALTGMQRPDIILQSVAVLDPKRAFIRLDWDSLHVG